METSKKRYAVVDLEATGTGAMAAIIQVGIIIVEGTRIVTTYATDVNPHEPLDQHIIDLTGITDEQLARAPTFGQVAADIYDLIKDCVFVAHNVHFDANLLAEHLFWEGYELRTDRVDTVELAQIFFPTLEKYNLESLSKALNLPLDSAHTAISDALATAHLLIKIQEKISALPYRTLAQLATYADSLIYETGSLLREFLQEADESVLINFEQVSGILLRRPEQKSFPSDLSLDLDFATNISHLGLDKRLEQEKFAKIVAERFGQGQAAFIEGTAGLGKTYAYLLPLLAQERSGQLVVAVPTKILQDQIIGKEGRSISQTFGISFASLKSSRHYLDLEKFARSLATKDSNRLINRYKMQLLVWLLETTTGDLDEIKQKQRLEVYFDSLRHDGKIRSEALFGEFDFWQRATQEDSQSQVLVTNHAFLLAALSDNPAYLAGKTLVLDEAQRFFLAMEESSRRQLELSDFLLQLSTLINQTDHVLTRRLLESIQRRLLGWVELFHKEKKSSILAEEMAALRQDFSELQVSLPELGHVLQDRYTDFWLESQFEQGKRQTYLRAASMDFLNISDFLQNLEQVYLISATIDISKRVTLPDLLGIEDYSVDYTEVTSNIRQEIWIDKTLPTSGYKEKPSYYEELADRLVALQEEKKPILVLMTNRDGLMKLSEQLEAREISHLAQDKHGSAQQIKKRFDRGDRPILLGLGSFWEGVDFINLSEMIVVIPKIPFDNPKDPFIKKLQRQLREEGKNPFFDYTLPVAGLRLKQALGRSRRREEQVSAVILLDQRLVSKNYGRSLQKSLAKLAPIHSENFTQILSEIKDFWYNETDSNVR